MNRQYCTNIWYSFCFQWNTNKAPIYLYWFCIGEIWARCKYTNTGTIYPFLFGQETKIGPIHALVQIHALHWKCFQWIVNNPQNSFIGFALTQYWKNVITLILELYFFTYIVKDPILVWYWCKVLSTKWNEISFWVFILLL